MNFNTWFSQLQTRTAQHAGAGLAAFKELLTRLDYPQNNYQIIHVAGTNGKGTVCTLLAHTLSCAGYDTGLFISPHLMSPTERMQINGQAISEADFVHAVECVWKAQKEPLNFFELLTAAALVYFAKQQVYYVVLETGLGGRKDPTSACEPILSIITSIGLDHTQFLGTTLAQIAAEKAGIIKPGVSVLCGDIPDEAVSVIEQAVLANHSPLTWVKEGNPFYGYAYDFIHGFTTLHTADRTEWNLHLLGEKQVQNACLVYHAARQLGVAENAIHTSFETVYLPGRFEHVKRGKTTFVLDGAHNPQAVQSLLNFWKKTPYALQESALLCGFMKDKDFEEMFTYLAPHFARVIVTMPPSPRAAIREDYGELLNVANITFEPDYHQAFFLAQQVSTVLCTGSFYLVGAVKKLI